MFVPIYYSPLVSNPASNHPAINAHFPPTHPKNALRAHSAHWLAQILRALALGTLFAAAASAHAQQTLDHFTGQFLPFNIDTGPLDNPTPVPRLLTTFPVKIKNAAWVRPYFSATKLPQGSFVRTRSTQDLQEQDLDAQAMLNWQNATAYFNGEEVWVELWAGPNTFSNRIILSQVAFELPRLPIGGPGQCGICNQDERTPSTQPWSGRIMPVGCSASVYCNADDGMVTAGHCLDGASNLVVHFNIPPSQDSCATQAPPVADQFPVLPDLHFQNAGVGADWGVIRTGLNNLGQTPFSRYGAFRPLATAPSSPGAPANIWGFGVDTNCATSQTQQLSPGTINARNQNDYDFNNDVRGGNSGSGLLNAAGQIIGIVTHCAFSGCNNRATRIDLPAFVAARQSLNLTCNGCTSNDLCSCAVNVSLGTLSGTTVGATDSGSAACGPGGPDVFYSFSPRCDGQYRFSTCGSSIDTSLSLHSACPASAANTIACNDTAPPSAACADRSRAEITATLLASETYILRVASPTAGAFILDVAALGVGSPNDSCANAQQLLPGQTVTGSTICDSNDGQAPCVNSRSNDIWYTITPTCSGVYTLSTCSPLSNFDTLLSVHTACPGTIANAIACNDDACASINSLLSVFLTAGTTYYVRAGAWDAGGSGIFALSLSAPPSPPQNDLCSNPQQANIGTLLGSTACASLELPQTCISSTSGDVFYRYTPLCDELTTFDTSGSTFDTLLSIYEVCTRSPLACDDNGAGNLNSRLSIRLSPGIAYIIRVGGAGNASGSFSLNISCEANPCPACAADYDQNGGVDGADVSSFFDEWSQGLPCADIDESGGIDGADVDTFFLLWSAGGC